jgi:hypothetical protein
MPVTPGQMLNLKRALINVSPKGAPAKRLLWALLHSSQLLGRGVVTEIVVSNKGDGFTRAALDEILIGVRELTSFMERGALLEGMGSEFVFSYCVHWDDLDAPRASCTFSLGIPNEDHYPVTITPGQLRIIDFREEAGELVRAGWKPTGH